MDGGHNAPATKRRRRLNHACNYCRSRKTRCDENKPSCHACLAAGIECITTDGRRPGWQVERHVAGKGRDTLSNQSNLPATPLLAATTSNAAPSQQQQQQLTSPSIPTPKSNFAGDNARASYDSRGRLDDPQHHHADHARQPEPETLPMFAAGDSVPATTIDWLSGWLELAIHRRKVRSRLPHRMTLPKFDADAPVVLNTAPPRLPELVVCEALLRTYHREVHSLFPIPNMSRIADLVRSHCTDQFEAPWRLPSPGIHYLLILIVLALGAAYSADEQSSAISLDAAGFVRSSLGHVLSVPSLESVQLVFLSALLAKTNDDIASTWPLLGLSVSMATSLGLNRGVRGRRPPSPTAPATFHDQRWATWWSIYSFERLNAFEMARMSAINDEDVPPEDSGMPTDSDGKLLKEYDHLSTLIGLAKVLGEAGRKCVRARNREEVNGTVALDKSIVEKIRVTGESCLMLFKWADRLPDDIKPTSDLLSGAQFPFVAFLSTQYNNALLMITRNSLLPDEADLRIAADVIAKDKPWEGVIRNGQAIAANAARRIIKLHIEPEDSDSAPLLPAVGPILHAVLVLSIYILVRPGSRMLKSDIALIQDACEFVLQLRRAAQSTTSQRNAMSLEAVIKQVNSIVTFVQSQLPSPSGRDSSTSRAAQRSGPGFSAADLPLLRPLDPVDGGQVSTSAISSDPGSGAFTNLAGHDDLTSYTSMDPMLLSPHDSSGFTPWLADGIGWDWGGMMQLNGLYDNADYSNV